MTDMRNFEAAILPWLDAGYNLARWLLHDESAADDVLQEASMRAFRYFASLRGNEAKPWFLGIVRNACFTHLQSRSSRPEQSGFEDDALEDFQYAAGLTAPDPGDAIDRGREHARVNAAIRALSPPLREVIVLRELESMEYAEIAQVASIPIGTVMSRLSRAREKLKMALSQTGVGE
ncbi:MAG: sigma-70 family RNA polymerase sigma factor [Burkholderiaceae bacterium]